ncbi:UDP binding domain-containing protein [Mesorhizobium sp. ES1-4]|uniref:UDP binding domain-containing protein n=1 Tax=Mesorhizobium sp. ES1-4 TaxID=2876627 RepID=UPI001CCC0AB9|nr:UDP binding domain-containing protein [Mesorhizobium sp. ES1-4]MBZ9798838.1 hypothetical protein [Mesorhizobium sp. ES1-4]
MKVIFSRGNGHWGLAFRHNTAYLRKAPARTLIEALWKVGANVHADELEAVQDCQAIYGLRERGQGGGTARRRCIVDCHRMESFRALSFDALKDALNTLIIFYGRNLFDPKIIAHRSIEYHGIARMAA